jgi:hypothetical protein
MLTAAAYGLLAIGVGSRAPLASNPSMGSSAATSISYEFSDFFNVPYGEWWDYRYAKYGDLPINAECFSAQSIPDGVCIPSKPNVKDVETAPYTNWYPLPGQIRPDSPGVNPLIYTPYRLRATAVGVTGYDLSDPVFLPILNPAQAPGSRLDFNWNMNYIDKATVDQMSAQGCPLSFRTMDGFIIRSQVTVTLDLQESRRIFGVVATTPSQATAWWTANTNPTCLGEGSAELALEDWFATLGGTQSVPGKYDIANSFEYYYTPFYTQMSATVDAQGLTTVTFDHVAWGTDVLMSRWFYWGRASYLANALDSTKATGWWGMELAWFEDFHFTGSLAASSMGFSLNSVMQYHFQLLSAAGPNGQYDRTDDIPYWTWGPLLTDYTNDWSPKHLVSELDRYPTATYVHTTPGSRQYAVNLAYDYPPIRWDLKAGETMRFQFPTGNVVFYDPNVTPIGTDPTTGAYVEVLAPFALMSTKPNAYGTWDAAARTWTLTGPTSTGGPVGSPGPDGNPGTVDDLYAFEPWGAINLEPSSLLRVTTNPAVPGKIIVDGVARDEWGLVWMKIAPGTHTVSFGGLSGLGTPADQTVYVVPGQTTVVQGNYASLGFLRVITSPALPSTISVNGVPRNDWGMWTALPPGTYTVHFGPVADYDAPADQQATVVAGATTTKTGTFTPHTGAPGPDPTTFGYLRVTTNPATAAQIFVNGIPRDDWGLTWVKLAPGTYTVSFGQGYGYTPPAPQTFTVTAGATTTWDAPFVAHGSLRVTTSPALAATVFVNGVPRDDWGMWQSMPPGTYTVSFEAFPGYVTPAPQTVVVSSGSLTPVTGTYTPAPASVQTGAASVAAPGSAATIVVKAPELVARIASIRASRD